MFCPYAIFCPQIYLMFRFNRQLIRTRGLFMGQEHKGKGVNVALGPMMNMGRIAQGGRNWEGFGADPFLAGEAAYETILGMQHGGVQACAKHFINKYVPQQDQFRVNENPFFTASKSMPGYRRHLTWMTERSMRFMLTLSCGVLWRASRA
jgi:Glycosyl hydrolase family 3 N terminal domain